MFDYFSEVPLNRNPNTQTFFSKSPQVLVLAILFVKWKFLYLMTIGILQSWGNSNEPLRRWKAESEQLSWPYVESVALKMTWLTPRQDLLLLSSNWTPTRESVQNDGPSQLKLSSLLLPMTFKLNYSRKVRKEIDQKIWT